MVRFLFAYKNSNFVTLVHIQLYCRTAEQRAQEEEDMALARAIAASEQEARRPRNRVLNFFVPPTKS